MIDFSCFGVQYNFGTLYSYVQDKKEFGLIPYTLILSDTDHPSYGIVASAFGRGHPKPPATPSLSTPLERVTLLLFPGVSSPAPGTHV
jgi:hypothetical protein